MSREAAIAQLVEVFRQYGYEGTTLTKLSEATGLGRASLYHYFPKGKEEMATAVLSYVGHWLELNILAPLKSNAKAADRIRTMVRKVDEFYSHGQLACLLSVLSVGEADDLFHHNLQRALNHWIDTLADVLVETGLSRKKARIKAEDAIIQIQGAIVLTRVLDDTAPFERVMKRLPNDLLNTQE